jgi:crotonobetainyl-CoA:carnitine CoA-transferase CaiB-like acyl-CoA transferase
LIAEADVLVYGLRSDALDALGYTSDALRARNPGLSIARVNAYGCSGPWHARRGFDSLVQMSAGIADRGMRAAAADKPVPLPVQALDHATGYLLAAAVVRALSRRAIEGVVSELRLSLARTALFMRELGVSETFVGHAPPAEEFAAFFEQAQTAWGPVRRIRNPGAIEGVTAHWSHSAGILGSSPPAWG